MSNQITGAKALQYLQSKQLIAAPGKYTLRVTSTTLQENGKTIINLKAIEPRGLAAAKEHLRAGEYQAASNTGMSTNVFADASFIPAKGEDIFCMVGSVPTRDGSTKLGITSISAIPITATTKVNLGDEFANLLDSVEAEEQLDLG